jgi:hypothetical protein
LLHPFGACSRAADIMTIPVLLALYIDGRALPSLCTYWGGLLFAPCYCNVRRHTQRGSGYRHELKPCLITHFTHLRSSHPRWVPQYNAPGSEVRVHRFLSVFLNAWHCGPLGSSFLGPINKFHPCKDY